MAIRDSLPDAARPRGSDCVVQSVVSYLDWFYVAIGSLSAPERPSLGLPINLTRETLGDRWSLIVIRDLMFGNRHHFRELLTRSEEGIASNG